MPLPVTSVADYLDRALPRIRRIMLVLAAAGTVASLVLFPWAVAAGFVVGAVISYLNQHGLERAIEALGERIANQQSRERGGDDLVPRGDALRADRRRGLCYI